MPADLKYFHLMTAGAFAGPSVDMSLYPIDTLRTRLQAKQGFFAAGGFRGIYRGLGVAAFGAAPAAGVFFVVYEPLRRKLEKKYGPLGVAVAACAGDTVASSVRVPTEVVKLRLQVGRVNTIRAAIADAVAEVGFRGLYKGFGLMLSRDIPFVMIQFPVYQALHQRFVGSRQDPASLSTCAVIGAVAGGFAGWVTTPLDFFKTRIMLEPGKRTIPLTEVVCDIAKREGVTAFWKGATPRTTFISLGGMVFFSAYEVALLFLKKL